MTKADARDPAGLPINGDARGEVRRQVALRSYASSGEAADVKLLSAKPADKVEIEPG